MPVFEYEKSFVVFSNLAGRWEHRIWENIFATPWIAIDTGVSLCNGAPEKKRLMNLNVPLAIASNSNISRFK